MRLARELGKSLAEVDRLGDDELRTWEAVDLIDPLGPRRVDLHFARLMSFVHGLLAKDPLTPAELIAKYWEPEPTPEERAAKVRAKMAAHRA